MEQTIRARAKEVGATSTVIRAGTLKGGGSGDTANGSGDASLLVGEVQQHGQSALLAVPSHCLGCLR